MPRRPQNLKNWSLIISEDDSGSNISKNDISKISNTGILFRDFDLQVEISKF